MPARPASSSLLVLALVLDLVGSGCAPSAESPAPVSPSAPAPPPPPPAPPAPPEGAIAIDCTVRAEIEAELAGDELRLRFVLQNIGPDPTTVTLRGTCPRGLVELGGLPAGFDPMHACQAGACRDPDITTTFTIPGGHKWVAIGETTLRGKGDACNPPLPAGSTFLQAAVVTEPHALHVCSGAMVHVVRDPKSGKLRRAGLLDEPVPATPPPAVIRPKRTPRPAEPAPTPTPTPTPPPTRKRDCPACGFACPNGIPSRKVGPDGCPTCSCERLDISP